MRSNRVRLVVSVLLGAMAFHGSTMAGYAGLTNSEFADSEMNMADSVASGIPSTSTAGSSARPVATGPGIWRNI
jgi:hypothetical protein